MSAVGQKAPATAGNKRIDLDAVHARIQQEGADALLARGEAAALIAARVKDRHDSARSARNRIAMQLDRARKNGGDATTGGLACVSDGRFTTDEIARWAGREYPGLFDDLPTKPRAARGMLSDRLRLGSDSYCGDVLPGTIDACHALIRQLRDQRLQELRDLERASLERKRQLAANFKKVNTNRRSLWCARSVFT
ncbi:hypothetical protein [Dokdonella soli]|uniref:DUF3102 domain-containing protein n=1 Tax=Dokdonella soli TaxID=529810 RepID=A0ABP3U5V0_9GAMM